MKKIINATIENCMDCPVFGICLVRRANAIGISSECPLPTDDQGWVRVKAVHMQDYDEEKDEYRSCGWAVHDTCYQTRGKITESQAHIYADLINFGIDVITDQYPGEVTAEVIKQIMGGEE